MDGIKKAALFLSGLEWKTVDLLLGRLDPESARAVRREMMSLGSESHVDADRLAGEFLEAVGGKRRRPPAVMEHRLDRRSGTYGPAPRPAARFSPQTDVATRPFDFLHGSEAEPIARELAGERPQTVAAVLAHLPASLTEEVLGLLPAGRQADVASRLADWETMDDRVLRDIEASLRQRFEHRMQSRPGRRRSFDDLERLDNAELATLFREVDPMTAMLALVGAKPSLIERVTQRFSPTEEYRMRRQLKRLGPITEDDVLKARNDVLRQLKMEN